MSLLNLKSYQAPRIPADVDSRAMNFEYCKDLAFTNYMSAIYSTDLFSCCSAVTMNSLYRYSERWAGFVSLFLILCFGGRRLRSLDSPNLAVSSYKLEIVAAMVTLNGYQLLVCYSLT